jgi:uncharacterized protein YlaI
MRKRNPINNYAPVCAYKDCTNKVGYHNVTTEKNGTISVSWKNCCEPHRNERKLEVDNWKLQQGCSNVDAHHGFKCTATIMYPEQLDINHIDGNRKNNNPANKEILCKNCHARVTIQNKHHLNRYIYDTILPTELFEEL